MEKMEIQQALKSGKDNKKERAQKGLETQGPNSLDVTSQLDIAISYATKSQEQQATQSALSSNTWTASKSKDSQSPLDKWLNETKDENLTWTENMVKPKVD
ncbi:hypothetical protein GLAREA_12752 [Glarea lozoyensis ATCC 20868]|uniref:Uncharacterized protein n=1 Tax=Glarea lozoyensis (strain ATCC 20868 / MF5171) TaxID=1116229 RepID=S3D2Q6_GLAL2|nr:uncharacterized protein GLAREA_12752 [Glarea lozoyensis ATCC 20868]EPE31449.1 hypothetical protein GLAREA_12752 [Glarea lozoyensis ATCC 20868]